MSLQHASRKAADCSKMQSAHQKIAALQDLFQDEIHKMALVQDNVEKHPEIYTQDDRDWVVTQIKNAKKALHEFLEKLI